MQVILTNLTRPQACININEVCYKHIPDKAFLNFLKSYWKLKKPESMKLILGHSAVDGKVERIEETNNSVDQESNVAGKIIVQQNMEAEIMKICLTLFSMGGGGGIYDPLKLEWQSSQKIKK